MKACTLRIRKRIYDSRRRATKTVAATVQSYLDAKKKF